MRYESKYDYLAHYGVKGQVHGRRRYQNEDGSLTPEGREHYGVGDPRQPGASSQVRPANPGAASKPVTAQQARGAEKQPNKGVEKQKNLRRMHSFLGKALAVTAAAAVAGYVGSKIIKNKANALLDREYSRDVRTAIKQHDLLSKNVLSGGYDTKTTNALLSNQRRSTNAHFDAYRINRDYQREKNNRSAIEAWRFIRGHR